MGIVKKPSNIKSWGEWFEKRAQYYEDPLLKAAYYVNGRPIAKEVMESTIEDVRRKLRVLENEMILDVGGGTGIFSSAFRSLTEHIYVTDISFTMSKNGRAMNPGSFFLVCEASSLPFEDSSFDKLLCYSVFHYLRDSAHVKKVLKEFTRVVKNKGLILIGDIPTNVCEIESIKKENNIGSKVKNKFPSFLKHDLKKLVFEPKFFRDYLSKERWNFKIVKQGIKGKATSSTRFDILIRVNKRDI